MFCILYINIYFKPYVLKLHILHMSSGSETFVIVPQVWLKHVGSVLRL